MNTANNTDRRSFLKKAAYVAPVVLAMGPLASHASATGSKIYTNTANQTTAQAGTNNTIIVGDGQGGTVTVQASGSTSGFSNFLRRKR